jgi:hypothetical protein
MLIAHQAPCPPTLRPPVSKLASELRVSRPPPALPRARVPPRRTLEPLRVIWSPPAVHNGAPITNHTIWFSKASSAPWTDQKAGLAVSAPLMALASGIQYFVRMSAWNSIDPSHFSALATATTQTGPSGLGSNVDGPPVWIRGLTTTVAAGTTLVALVVLFRRRRTPPPAGSISPSFTSPTAAPTSGPPPPAPPGIP